MERQERDRGRKERGESKRAEERASFIESRVRTYIIEVAIIHRIDICHICYKKFYC